MPNAGRNLCNKISQWRFLLDALTVIVLVRGEHFIVSSQFSKLASQLQMNKINLISNDN